MVTWEMSRRRILLEPRNSLKGERSQLWVNLNPSEISHLRLSGGPTPPPQRDVYLLSARLALDPLPTRIFFSPKYSFHIKHILTQQLDYYASSLASRGGWERSRVSGIAGEGGEY
jgi:hypothetical protein